MSVTPKTPRILDVWLHNLPEAIKLLYEQVEYYPYVSIDTEFPGVLAKPIGNFSNNYTKDYQKLRINVDILNIIQLGLTLANSNGEKPEICTFQFNFAYDLNTEMYNKDSIGLLKKSEIDFEKHKNEGIPPEDFAYLFVTSGLVCEKNITWISFHSLYDFAYLIKILTFSSMPQTEKAFYEVLYMNFINLYDIKYLLRNTKYVKKGLQDISRKMGLKRYGIQHQAGSDSMLTSDLFFYIKKNFLKESKNFDSKNFDSGEEEETIKSESIESCKGKLYGLANWES